LQRLVARGEVERLGRGLYTLAGQRRDERQDLAEAARRVPAGIVCLLSALRFHHLTTQDPFEVWMAVGHKAWRSRVDHPPLRLVFLTGRALTEGIESHKVNGVEVRVFSAAKTVADCFKFRNKIGIDVAVEALREFRRLHPKELQAVWEFARVDRVARVIQPYLDSL
ncbi:MAG: transcriptional regulator, partial [Patescibacteria group bacterium]